MTLSELTIDNTRSYMVDVHGKKYPIKQQRGRYYIQHATGQLTVTSLVKSCNIETGTIADYIFNGWFETYNSFETYKQYALAEIAWVK